MADKVLKKEKRGNRDIVVVKKEEQPAPQQAPAPNPAPEPIQTVFDTKIDAWNCILFRKPWREVMKAVAGIEKGTPLKLEIKPDGIYLRKA